MLQVCKFCKKQQTAVGTGRILPLVQGSKSIYYIRYILEVVFISISHRLANLIAGILRYFPLESVRIPAEKRLVYQQKSMAIQRTLLMKTTS